MKPEVSIIIPAYNTENYIFKAIDSALNQTISNIEVIVIDDASTDNTLAVIKKFKDHRLKILVNEKNLGVSGTRNRALRIAEGQWVAVLDSDDWYAPERLEKLLQIAYSEQADMVADDLFFIENGKDYPWSTLIREGGECIKQLKLIDTLYFVETDIFGKQGLHLGLSQPMIKRDFLINNSIKYDERLRINEDFWLYLECLLFGAKFILVPEPYYFYRSRPGSLVHSSAKQIIEVTCLKITELMAMKDLVNGVPNLAKALSNKVRISRNSLAYYQVVESIKKKQYFNGLIQIINNPYFFALLTSYLPGIIDRIIKKKKIKLGIKENLQNQ
ncbi:MAG: glycosyltransferase family 2 protein [Nostoc sp.]|uniref:glycosyltransferase family 2 protein n=1 Tax=Nostoc sp. TaxID=1180 RepID=UPI002FFA24BB